MEKKKLNRKNDKLQELLQSDKLSHKRFLFVAVWFFCYMLCFFLLEDRVFVDWNIIHSRLDDFIPFKPGFIYIYMFWFPYVASLTIWFAWLNKSENADKVIKVILTGMTLFLLISWIYPNGLNFRQYLFYEHGTLAGLLVQMLHSIDTPTNVFPSMHVFMTLAIQIGLEHEQKVKGSFFLQWGTRIIAILIILSTVFLKQHSIVDVCGGFLLAALLYSKYYLHDERKKHRLDKQ